MPRNTTVREPEVTKDGQSSGPGSTAAVGIKDVAVRFRTKNRDVTALTDIDLEVPMGQFVAIVGPSGCGKSTLLKLVAGLLKPSAGDVLLNGERVQGRATTSATSSSARPCWSGVRRAATSCCRRRCGRCRRSWGAGAPTNSSR